MDFFYDLMNAAAMFALVVIAWTIVIRVAGSLFGWW
jgi:hypothetical protein